MIALDKSLPVIVIKKIRKSKRKVVYYPNIILRNRRLKLSIKYLVGLLKLSKKGRGFNPRELFLFILRTILAKGPVIKFFNYIKERIIRMLYEKKPFIRRRPQFRLYYSWRKGVKQLYARFYKKFRVFNNKKSFKYVNKFKRNFNRNKLKYGLLAAGEKLRLLIKTKDLRSLRIVGYITTRLRWNKQRILPYTFYKYTLVPYRRLFYSNFMSVHEIKFVKWNFLRIIKRKYIYSNFFLLNSFNEKFLI